MTSDDDDEDYAANLEEELLENTTTMNQDINLLEGETSTNPQTSLEESTKNACTHPGSFKCMCIVCGQILGFNSGLNFGYIHNDLWIQNDEIDRLLKIDLRNLIRRKKLYLVLDLDHTLLNCSLLSDLSPEEEYLKNHIDGYDLEYDFATNGGDLFMFDCLTHMPKLAKLRPFVRTFLKEVSKLFELHIYTLANREYALTMVKILDPRTEYFHDGVISREHCTQKFQKSLDVVLGIESGTVIIDDSDFVWNVKDKDNLIVIKRYHFFRTSCRAFGIDSESLAEMKIDEPENEGALKTVLKVLNKIHSVFFEEDGHNNVIEKDVKQVMKSIRKQVLEGCKIVFPSACRTTNHKVWEMAEELGAICVTDDLDDSVTHVVSKEVGLKKSMWALKMDKLLVHQDWIEISYYLWEKQPEHKFLLNF